ncbi:unnamed protein product [Ceratitis capitata]|uniref:(Mediterranean fruit fly) hypothetical protein n=1 Tax=Ceratitis capitata TaxID=7213 RepID=A0A811UBA0_CERCA|nr:unnamed protein product [Ceratitis capitata]
MNKQRIDASYTEEQWEKDLEAELKDYEVVGGTTTGGPSTTHSRDRAGGTVNNANGDDGDDEIPTISNLRTRTTNNDWEEEYADLIEDTDDLKTLKSLKRVMLGYQKAEEFFTIF